MAAVDPFEFFLEKAWSDGFPVVTPTEERVQWMLAGTRRDPDELIGRVPPALEPVTVRTARSTRSWPAASPNTCRWCSAACAIILREEFNMGGVQCTMHGVAPLMIVNGPYAQRDRAARRQRLLRPGLSRERHDRPRDAAHAAESRRRASPGKASATVFSSPIRYTACLTENMARSPVGDLAVSRGYAPEDNVITCAMVESPRLHFDDVSTEPERLLIGIADSMTRRARGTCGSAPTWWSR